LKKRFFGKKINKQNTPRPCGSIRRNTKPGGFLQHPFVEECSPFIENFVGHDVLSICRNIKIMATKTKKEPLLKSAKNGSQAAARGDSMLREFFVDELKDIYWAEKHIVSSLPKMAKAATSQDLKDAFTNHLEETRGHVSRLEDAFKKLGEKAVAKKCDAMEGILKEGSGIIDETEQGTATRDVGLILAAQKVEHYEISTYGGLAQLARTLGEDEVARLLENTLEEEKAADIKLTEVAEDGVNYEAAEEEED
jgi:ferritin-like metal-binding protein YciE